jgi:hypothetical protein
MRGEPAGRVDEGVVEGGEQAGTGVDGGLAVGGGGDRVGGDVADDERETHDTVDEELDDVPGEDRVGRGVVVMQDELAGAGLVELFLPSAGRGQRQLGDDGGHGVAAHDAGGERHRRTPVRTTTSIVAFVW